MPVISADFFYLSGSVEAPRFTLGEEEEEMVAAGVGAPEEELADGVAPGGRKFGKRPILVLWERDSHALYSIVLPNKRVSTRYTVDNAVRCIDRQWGFAGQRIVLKGDGEPALQAALEAVAKERAGEATVEVTRLREVAAHSRLRADPLGSPGDRTRRQRPVASIFGPSVGGPPRCVALHASRRRPRWQDTP